MFRAALCQAVPRSDGSKGGRPPFDHVLMFKVLILQSMHSLSDERCEYLIKDRLSFMRLLALGLTDAVPDANTIWTSEALTRATIEGEWAVGVLFQRFDAAGKYRTSDRLPSLLHIGKGWPGDISIQIRLSMRRMARFG